MRCGFAQGANRLSFKHEVLVQLAHLLHTCFIQDVRTYLAHQLFMDVSIGLQGFFLTFFQANKVVTKLRLHGLAQVAGLAQFIEGIFKRLHHFPSPEKTEITAAGSAARVNRIGLGQLFKGGACPQLR